VNNQNQDTMNQKYFSKGVWSILFVSIFSLSQNPYVKNLELKTANGHPMQYYISLSDGYTTTKKWPVVLVLEAAEKEYKANAERFVSARGKMPFIILAPIHTNNGNQGRRDPNLFPYSKETWDYIDKVGDCQFNEDGIRQIIKDVKEAFQVEEKIFVTGFEAGTHQLWSLVFSHPEYFKAVASVAGNYRGRCVDAKAISTDSSRINLPIMAFSGLKDEAFGPNGFLYEQWKEVKTLAEKNGFKNIKETILPEGGHSPVPKDVLDYFNKFVKIER
jgi:poly(3-hydroxybutyrate) depolymerase